MTNRRMLGVIVCVAWVLSSSIGRAQAQVNSPGAEIARAYRVVPNVTYLTASNWESKLDVYTPRDARTPVPTIIYIHGGWWVSGSKEASALSVLPYLERGLAVVNVEYRLGAVALAPAAVEDCRCALRWVIRNAKTYNFDTRRIVTMGPSAGGHLAVMTGILPPSAGFDRLCPGEEPLQVAAVVNWYGAMDVNDVIAGPNTRPSAEQWFGSQPDRETIARRVTPLIYVRPGIPPVLTIHGDADPIVPYAHALRLQEALTKAGVPNQLVTVPGGGHGGFDPAQTQRVYGELFAFLAKQGVIASPPAGAPATRP